jgi:hypothetical protein
MPSLLQRMRAILGGGAPGSHGHDGRSDQVRLADIGGRLSRDDRARRMRTGSLAAQVQGTKPDVTGSIGNVNTAASFTLNTRRAGPAVKRCLPPLHLLVRAWSAFGGLRALAGVLAAGPVT